MRNLNWAFAGVLAVAAAHQASAQTQAQAHAEKEAFLQSVLSPKGLANYHSMINFMSPRAPGVVGPEAWYLSILGVAPGWQGKGLGARLLQPTLLEADAAGATCFLETFSTRNHAFYARLGFHSAAAYFEPVSGHAYHILLRPPGAT